VARFFNPCVTASRVKNPCYEERFGVYHFSAVKHAPLIAPLLALLLSPTGAQTRPTTSTAPAVDRYLINGRVIDAATTRGGASA